MKQGDKVNIKVTQTDGYVVSDVKGTQLCSDISEVDNILRPIHKLRHETGDEINRIIAKQQVPSPEIRQNMTSYNDRIKEIKANFITSHLTDEVAAYLLLGIRLKDALALYEQMDKSLFANTFKVVEEQIIEIQNIGRIKSNAERELTVDSVAPDFTLKDASNKDFRLSSLQGKWVVIDFWGTWCGWCIKGFPKMKEIYAKYKDSLEIVAVNCIDSDERWTEAIKKHSLPWINVKNNNNVSARYAVSVYPTKIIITPEGRIHKVFTGESDDFYNEIDKIMK